MSEHSSKLDGVIDDALRELTGGAPADGLRRRVLDQIAAETGPGRRRRLGVVNWLAHPFRLATVVVLAVIALTSALSVSRFVQPKPTAAVDAGRISHPGAPAEGTAAVSRPLAPSEIAASLANTRVPIARPATMVTATRPPLRGPASIPRAATAPPPTTADEGTIQDTVAGIVPLPDPNPIASRPIEIAPLVIQPVANREIHIPSIETGGPQKGPGQTDKR
jgi:hypothetical protein